MFFLGARWRAAQTIRLSNQKASGGDATIDRIRPYLASLRGAVLEIGAGAGGTMPYLPVGCRYTALEPNVYLRDTLIRRAGERGLTTPVISTASAEQMPFADSSFEAIVSVRSLCAVSDLPRALREVRRVLKPGGIFIFAEHVAAPANQWQYYLQLLARLVFPCDPVRNIERELRAAGFHELRVERFNSFKSKTIIQPRISGFARN